MEEPSIQKWDYFFVKHLLKKFRETRSMDRRLSSGWPRTVSKEENMDLIEELFSHKNSSSICIKDQGPSPDVNPLDIFIGTLLRAKFTKEDLKNCLRQKLH